MADPITPPPAADAPPRARILQAAHRLFYRDGVRATGVDRLIAESGVAKLTFYRQFPGKQDLVLAFLAERHARWMAWFEAALATAGGTPAALVPALREWLASDDFRGCAFINSVGELGEQPEVLALCRAHKTDMERAIAALLPAGKGRAATAQALSVAVDGAIVRAQRDGDAAAALKALGRLVAALTTPPTA